MFATYSPAGGAREPSQERSPPRLKHMFAGEGCLMVTLLNFEQEVRITMRHARESGRIVPAASNVRRRNRLGRRGRSHAVRSNAGSESTSSRMRRRAATSICGTEGRGRRDENRRPPVGRKIRLRRSAGGVVVEAVSLQGTETIYNETGRAQAVSEASEAPVADFSPVSPPR